MDESRCNSLHDGLMRDFSVLSDVEFEELCADLLQTASGVAVRRYAKGKDKGKDLIWEEQRGQGIAQCKHYVKSNFSQLLAAAKAEVPKVKKNNPARYLFMTSQSTVETQNKQVYDLFSEWMVSIDDVWNLEKINDLLNANQDVETRHLKLWLHSGLQLFWATNSALHNRSRALADRVSEDLPRFVKTRAFDIANETLDKENVCLIAGAPGVGKTMLSHALIARLMAEGFLPIEISGDVEEGWAALDLSTKQVFFYDDFLGELALSERLSKKEDRRLVNFIQEISKSARHKLILTTREYILKDAEHTYPLLQKIEKSRRHVLEMPNYDRLDRGRILYNHLYHSSLPQEYREQFSRGAWQRVVDHDGYSPRLIEYATSQLALGFDGRYLEAFVSTLDSPELLWSNAFENHLEEFDRVVLQVMCTHGRITYSELEESLRPYDPSVGPITQRRVNRSLKTLDGTFLRTSKIADQIYVSFHNPAVREFLLEVLRTDRLALRTVIDRTVSTSQVIRLAQAGSGHLSYNRLNGKLEPSKPQPIPLHLVRDNVSKAIQRLLPLDDLISSTEKEKVDRERDLSELATLHAELPLAESWWASQLTAVAGIWNEGIGTPTAIKNILEFATGRPGLEELRPKLEEAAREALMAAQINDDEEWGIVFDVFTDLLGSEVPNSLIDEFEVYLYDAIATQGMNLTNIDELMSMASNLDLLAAVEDLEEHARTIYEYEQIMEEDREGWSSKTIQNDGTEAALRTLFDRFRPAPSEFDA